LELPKPGSYNKPSWLRYFRGQKKKKKKEKEEALELVSAFGEQGRVLFFWGFEINGYIKRNPKISSKQVISFHKGPIGELGGVFLLVLFERKGKYRISRPMRRTLFPRKM
jgi:hypothetical protein